MYSGMAIGFWFLGFGILTAGRDCNVLRYRDWVAQAPGTVRAAGCAEQGLDVRFETRGFWCECNAVRRWSACARESVKKRGASARKEEEKAREEEERKEKK